MSESLNECITRKMLLWLPEQSPAVWHMVAMSWNWSDDPAPLAWIAEQPNCDRGTAQTIFWNGEPSEYAMLEGGRDDVPEYRRNIYDLLTGIASRWNDGFYKVWRYRTLPDILGPFRLYKLPPENRDLAIHESLTERQGDVDFDEVDVPMLEGQPISVIKSCYLERGEKVPGWL